MNTIKKLLIILLCLPMIGLGQCVSGDCENGYGTYIFGKGEWEGDKYVGEFKDGLSHGQGTYTYANGDKYVGEYKYHKFNGLGTYTYGRDGFDGDKYVGEHKDNKMHGQGTYTWADGSKYVGEYKNDKMNGQGILTYFDGDRYQGEWNDNKFNGQGTYTYNDGRIKKGLFEKGKFIGVSLIGKTQDITDFFEPSYKQQLSENTTNKAYDEYYDEQTRTYSNYKYGISYKEMKGWKIDMGVAEHTIFRSYELDSGYSFMINVIEVNIPKNEQDMDAHKLLDGFGVEAYQDNMKQQMSHSYPYIAEVNSRKTYFRGFKAIRTTMSMSIKQDEYADIYKFGFYQVIRGTYMYSVGIIYPEELYDDNLNDVFYNVGFLMLRE